LRLRQWLISVSLDLTPHLCHKRIFRLACTFVGCFDLSHGESQVTGSGAAAAVLQNNAAIKKCCRIFHSGPFVSLCHCDVESKKDRIRRVK
jgi:hypothetical protein